MTQDPSESHQSSYVMLNRQWSSREAAFRYAKSEGFHVGTMTCRYCGYKSDAVIETPESYDPYHCQCQKCRNIAAWFTKE